METDSNAQSKTKGWDKHEQDSNVQLNLALLDLVGRFKSAAN